MIANAYYQAMDEEAENMIRKLWRMVIYFTEAKKRHLD
jgi:hypothetical protein